MQLLAVTAAQNWKAQAKDIWKRKQLADQFRCIQGSRTLLCYMNKTMLPYL